MDRGCFFVIPGIHPSIEYGIAGLYNRFARVMAIRDKSAIGLIFLGGQLVATFTFGDDSDNQALLELAESSRQKLSARFSGRSELFYKERSLRSDNRLMVVAYQIVIDEDNLVNALDRYDKFAKKRPKKGKDFSNCGHEENNPFSDQYAKRCVWCGTRKGQFHGIICRGEICPRCKGSLLYCDCTRMPDNIQPDEGWRYDKDSWWPSNDIRIVY